MVGVGTAPSGVSLADHVLGNFSHEVDLTLFVLVLLSLLSIDEPPWHILSPPLSAHLIVDPIQ